MKDKTLILGATDNPSRYAYAAAERLKGQGVPFVPVGVRKGEVFGQPIVNDREPKPDIHTVTVYVGPARQAEWEEYLLATRPKRVIFNPGAENPALAKKLEAEGIETVFACTLVMLATDQY